MPKRWISFFLAVAVVFLVLGLWLFSGSPEVESKGDGASSVLAWPGASSDDRTNADAKGER